MDELLNDGILKRKHESKSDLVNDDTAKEKALLQVMQDTNYPAFHYLLKNYDVFVVIQK